MNKPRGPGGSRWKISEATSETVLQTSAGGEEKGIGNNENEFSPYFGNVGELAMKNDEQDNEMMGFFKKSVASRVNSPGRRHESVGRSSPGGGGEMGKGKNKTPLSGKGASKKRSNQHGTKTNKQNLAGEKGSE